MGWTLAVIGFVAQLLYCVYGKGKRAKVLPLLVMAAIAALTLVASFGSGLLGFAGGMWLFWGEVKILFGLILAWVIYKLVLFTK